MLRKNESTRLSLSRWPGLISSRRISMARCSSWLGNELELVPLKLGAGPWFAPLGSTLGSTSLGSTASDATGPFSIASCWFPLTHFLEQHGGQEGQEGSHDYPPHCHPRIPPFGSSHSNGSQRRSTAVAAPDPRESGEV